MRHLIPRPTPKPENEPIPRLTIPLSNDGETVRKWIITGDIRVTETEWDRAMAILDTMRDALIMAEPIEDEPEREERS